VNTNLDLTDSVVLDLTIEKGKLLDKTIICQVVSGGSAVGFFNFSNYTADLIVKKKPNDFVTILSFSTADDSIEFGSNGQLRLSKTAIQTNIRSGQYVYDLDLTNSGGTRGFLRGYFHIVDPTYSEVTNGSIDTDHLTVTVKGDVAITSGGSLNVTANNGLTKGGNNIVWGGTLTGDTTIAGSGTTSLSFDSIYNLNLNATSLQGEVGQINFNATGGNISLYSDTQLSLQGESGVTLLANNGSLNLGALGTGNIKLIFDSESELQINNDPGTAGYVLTSQGSDLPPVWSQTVNVDANNGLTKDGDTISLGGTLISDTNLFVANNYSLDVTLNNDGEGTFSGFRVRDVGNQYSMLDIAPTSGITIQSADEPINIIGSSSTAINISINDDDDGIYVNDNYVSIFAGGFSSAIEMTDATISLYSASALPQSYGSINLTNKLSLEGKDSSNNIRTQIILASTGATFVDNRVTKNGLQYAGIYSMLKHSLVDKHFVTGLTASFVTLTGSQTITNKTLSTGTVISASPTINDGIKISFKPANNAGLNVGAASSDPPALENWDLWANSGSNTLKLRVGGTTKQIPYTASDSIGVGSIPFFGFANQAQMLYESDFVYDVSTNTLTTGKLKLGEVPATATGLTQLLVRDSTSGVVKIVNATGLTTANNGLTKTGNNFSLGGVIINDTTQLLTYDGLTDVSYFIQTEDGSDSSINSRLEILTNFGSYNTALRGSNPNGSVYFNVDAGGNGHFGFDYGDGARAFLYANAGSNLFTFQDERSVKTGIEYAANYSSNFGARSLVDKGYVTGLTSGYMKLGGTNNLTGHLDIAGASTYGVGFSSITYFDINTAADIFFTIGGSPYTITSTTGSEYLHIDSATFDDKITGLRAYGGKFQFGVYDFDFYDDASRVVVLQAETDGGSTTALKVYDSRGGSARGIEYAASGYVTDNRSLTDKEYVDNHQLRSYTVSTLPSASPAGRMIYVSNESGGAVPAFSDGTNWRRVTDRNIVS
jgi:hypothetical protein